MASKVRKYLASKELPFVVLLILDDSPGHTELHKFTTEGVIKVVCLSPNTVSILQPVTQGFIRTFKAHYTLCSIERIVNIVKHNPSRENTVNVWKDYTIEDAIVVTERAVRATKPERINSRWRRLCADVHGFAGFMAEPMREVTKEIVGIAEKVGGGVKGFKIWIV